MNLTQMRARRSEIAQRVQELNAITERALTAEENTEYNALLDEADALSASIADTVTRDSRSAALITLTTEPDPNRPNIMGRSVGTGIDPGPPSRGTRPSGEPAPVERDALIRSMQADLAQRGAPDTAIRAATEDDEAAAQFEPWLRSFRGDTGSMARAANNPAFRALNESNWGDGGAVIPASILRRVIERRQNSHDRLLGAVSRYPCSTDRLTIPKFLGGTATQSSALAVQWQTENGTVTEDTSLENWGSVGINVHRGGFVVVASRSWMEDGAFPLEQWVVGQIANCYNATLANLILNGSGVGRARGILQRLSGAEAVPTSNIGTAIAFSGLMGLMGDLQAEYAENASFVMRRATLYGSIFSDTENGAVLFGTRNTTDGGTQPRIDTQMFGHPVIQSDFMPASGSANNSVIFGDLAEGYGLVERIALTIEPHIDPAIQKKDQVAWYVRCRVGGDVIQENALRVAVQS